MAAGSGRSHPTLSIHLRRRITSERKGIDWYINIRARTGTISGAGSGQMKYAMVFCYRCCCCSGLRHTQKWRVGWGFWKLLRKRTQQMVCPLRSVWGWGWAGYIFSWSKSTASDGTPKKKCYVDGDGLRRVEGAAQWGKVHFAMWMEESLINNCLKKFEWKLVSWFVTQTLRRTPLTVKNSSLPWHDFF